MLGCVLLAFPAGALAIALALARRSAPGERAVLAGAAVLLVASALLSPSGGLPANDQWTHYLHARAAAVDPARLLDLWDRPGFMLLAAGPSALGQRAARLAAIATALVALAATMRAAAALGLPRPWLAGALALAQYDFFGQATSTMTELPFAAALALAVLGWAEDRPWLVAAGLGWMGITRPEGPAYVAVGALGMLLRWRRPLPALAAGVPFLLYAALGAVVFDDLRWMLTRNPYRDYVGVRLDVAQLRDSYFFAALGLSQGGALVLLEAAGALAAALGPARRLRFLLPVVAVTFVLLTFLRIGPTDGWRESRYLVSIAPALALLAAAGVETALARLPGLAPPALLVWSALVAAQQISICWQAVGLPMWEVWPELMWTSVGLAAALSLLRRWLPARTALAAVLLLPIVAVPPGILSRHRADLWLDVPAAPASAPGPRQPRRPPRSRRSARNRFTKSR